jgi:hypothetical protein
MRSGSSASVAKTRLRRSVREFTGGSRVVRKRHQRCRRQSADCRSRHRCLRTVLLTRSKSVLTRSAQTGGLARNALRYDNRLVLRLARQHSGRITCGCSGELQGIRPALMELSVDASEKQGTKWMQVHERATPAISSSASSSARPSLLFRQPSSGPPARPAACHASHLCRSGSGPAW